MRLGVGAERVGGRAAHRRDDDIDAVAEQPRARTQRKRRALDDDVGAGMGGDVAAGNIDAAADALADPVILAFFEQVQVAGQRLPGHFGHLCLVEARVDADVAQRPVKPVQMLGKPEDAPAEGPRHIEHGVAVTKAAVAERQPRLVFGDEVAVEPDHPSVRPVGHGRGSPRCAPASRRRSSVLSALP